MFLLQHFAQFAATLHKLAKFGTQNLTPARRGHVKVTEASCCSAGSIGAGLGLGFGPAVDLVEGMIIPYPGPAAVGHAFLYGIFLTSWPTTKNSLFAHSRFSTLFFSMKMAESEKLVFETCIIDFDNIQV